MRPNPFVSIGSLAALALCAAAFLLCPRPATATAAAGTTPAIVIDGNRLSADVPALVSDGHVLVPLRGVFEQFGAAVWFDEGSGVATATAGSTTVQVLVGSRQARVNGAARTMDVPAREVAGRVMVPLRFVALALGVSVDYDAATNTVVIVTGWRPGSFAAYAGGPTYTTVARAAPTVEDTRPAYGQIVGSQYPSIYARFNGGTSAVNPQTVQIQVDGVDVTDQSTVSSAYVSYTPSTAMQTGLHNVSIVGQADDGTPFTESWSFRVDAGTSSDYTVGTYGSGGGFGFGPAQFGFGWPWFHRFGFSPPGFSVFTPGPLFFVAGGVIEVVFVSRFFPVGNAFFSISGCPGAFALTPWLGNPGFFWGVMQVPFGVNAQNAVIAAHFTMSDGRQVVVHSTAPLQIEGQRRRLPDGLRYAVLPRLVNHPSSLRGAVVFDRDEPPAFNDVRVPVGSRAPGSLGAGWTNGAKVPGYGRFPGSGRTAFPAMTHGPVLRLPEMPRMPITVRPPTVIRPVPIILPAIHAPFAQWQIVPGMHPPVLPAPPAKPR